jgi:hypothetical protein
MSRRPPARLPRLRIRRPRVAGLLAWALFVARVPLAGSQSKPALILVTKDLRVQPALKKICDRAGQGDLAGHYRDVVWLVHTVDTPAAVTRLPPGDVSDQVTDQLYAIAAAQTQVQSCQQGGPSPRPERPLQFLLLEIVGSKLAGEDTVAIRLMRPPDAPEPRASPLEYAYHTDLGDPVDVEKFTGCLAWQLWQLPRWLHASTSCKARGLNPEPPAPPPVPPLVDPSLPSGLLRDRAPNPGLDGVMSASAARGLRWSPAMRNVVIGAGAVGVLAGSVFGVRALTLSDGCPACTRTQYDRAMFNAHLSSAGFAVGVVAGLVLGWRYIFTSREPDGTSAAKVAPTRVSLAVGGGQISFGGWW